MATRVEITTRNTRSDILNEAKSTRSYVSPLSDASNKSSDSTILSSLIIDEETVPSKPMNMFNTGLKPRLSPKPFTREKPPENRRSVGMSALSADMKSQSDVPFHSSASVSLSGSAKTEASERGGRRIFTSSYQTEPEEDQVNKSDSFSPTLLGKRQTSFSWMSTDPGDSKLSSQVNEPKVTSKPPVMSRKPDVPQQQEKIHVSSLRKLTTDATDEQKVPLDKPNSSQSESINSLTVRAQLRPKRRPVSAMFLDSVSDQTSESKIIEKPRPWNRRPLSEDLTSLFESGVLANKTESPSEETKENRPLRKSSLKNSITEDQPDLTSKVVEPSSTKSGSNETTTSRSGISSVYSKFRSKDSFTETRSNMEQEKTTPTDVDSVVRRSASNLNQDSKAFSDYTDGSSNEVKNADDGNVAPGTMKRRISLYLANTSSSVDSSDSPTSKDKPTPTVERKARAIASDKDMEFGRQQTASQYQTAEIKNFSPSTSNIEQRSEKNDDQKSTLDSQDTGVQKEKRDWRTREFSEDKLRTRRSFRKVEEPIQQQDNKEVFSDKKSHVYKDRQYDNKTEEAEDKYKQPVYLDNTFKTVKATMFEHNVEWHSPPELLDDRNPLSSQPPRSDILLETRERKKDSESWSKWLSDDSVHSVTQLHKDGDVSDMRFNSSRVGKTASTTDHDVIQNPKVDEKRRIEPRFEVIPAVGERVSSESIQMAPEDKAVTLRSRRSFHRNERELQNSEGDESVLRRPVSNLQRSKSEYRRRDTSSQENSTNKYVSRDLDFAFTRKNSLRSEKNDLVKAPDDRAYEAVKKTSNVDTTVSDFQPKSYKLDYKLKKENASDKYSNNQSPYGIGATDGKDVKKSSNDFNQHAHRSYSDLIDKGLETKTRTIIDEPAVSNSNRVDIKKYVDTEEVNKESYQWKKFFSEKESPATRKDNKEESNYLISEMLSNEVEQFKKDLVVTPATKDTDSFLRPVHFREENTEEYKWERKKTPVQDRNTSDSSTGNTSDLYGFEYMETKRGKNLSITSPTDQKATYFAITGLDNKRDKNDSNFESQSSGASSWKSDEYFKRDVSMSTTISEFDVHSKKPEAIHSHGDAETTSAFKELKTHGNQRIFEDEFKSDKSVEKKSVIDIDALIKRHRQKASLDDRVTSPRDVKPEQKIFATDLDTTQGSPLKLDRSYKSKVVDIDSLMADYNAKNEKDSTSRDDYTISKWERSKSFKESASKTSDSKWRDPSVRHVKREDKYQFETVGSWYSSQTATSATEDTKQDSHKILGTAEYFKTPKYEHYREKESDQEFQAFAEERHNTAGFSQESPTLSFENYKSRPLHTSESPTVLDRSTSHTVAKTVVEMSVDEEDPSAKLHHRSSMKTERKSVVTVERQPISEGSRPAKASDLIGLMLENREKRIEQRRARQNIPVEHQNESRTQKSRSQQEWHYSERKEYSEKESFRQHTKLQRETETVVDLSRRKSLNRQREWDLRSDEDHLKQCFSRTSTSNKDTDSLVQDPDRQYGTWSQDKHQTEDSCVTDSPSYDNSSRKQHSHSRLSSLSHTETDQHDSMNEARDGSLDRCSMDLDSTEGTESTPSEAKSVDFSFMDQTSVLDSTALKNRVQLSRKSQRRAPSQLQRRSRLLQSSSQLAVIEDTDNLWMYTDSTEEKPEKKEEVEEEQEKPQRSSVHSPRMPMFPGMDHSTLMAQLRKRQDAESSTESSPQVSKSPKSPLPHGTLGVKLLPTSADKQDQSAGESPQWLKELKSKKRQSQYENHS